MGDLTNAAVRLGNLLSARFALLCLIALVNGCFWMVPWFISNLVAYSGLTNLIDIATCIQPLPRGRAAWFAQALPESLLPALVVALWPQLLPADVDGIVGALGLQTHPVIWKHVRGQDQ